MHVVVVVVVVDEFCSRRDWRIGVRAGFFS
jgi:hypothetical protein